MSQVRPRSELVIDVEQESGSNALASPPHSPDRAARDQASVAAAVEDVVSANSDASYVDADESGDGVRLAAVSTAGVAGEHLGAADVVADTGARSREKQPAEVGRKRPRSPLQELEASENREGEPQSTNDCPICFEPWEKNGPHRLVALRCGHLMGQSCAKACLQRTKSCPMCKAKSSYKHVRLIYGAPSVLRVAECRELDAEREKVAAKEAEIAQLRAKCDAFQSSLAELQRDLAARSSRILGSSSFFEPQRSGRVTQYTADSHSRVPPFCSTSGQQESAAGRASPAVCESLDRLFDVATGGESTALAFDPAGSILISETRPNAQSCVRRISLVNPRASTFHRSEYFTSTQVSCLSICNQEGPGKGQIAAACGDRALRIFDSRLRVVTRYLLPGVPRSCCWLTTHPSIVMVGMSNGTILAFDTAATSVEPLKEISMPRGRLSPAVHTLVQLSRFPGAPSGAILAASISSVAVLSFGDTAGFSVRVEQVADGEQCGAASVFDSFLVLSSRDVSNQNGKHEVFNRMSRTNERAIPASGGIAGRTSEQVVLGASWSPCALTGFKAMRPIQHCTVVPLSPTKVLVSSGDAQSARVWIGTPGEAQQWQTFALDHGEGAGPVKGIQSFVPPRGASLPPLLAVLYGGKLCVFKAPSQPSTRGERGRRAMRLA